MLRLLSAAAAALALAACASTPDRNAGFDLIDMQRRLDARGIGFGVGLPPGGGDGVLFTLRFRTADADDAAPITEADFRAAAEAAAPEGCTLAALTPQADGGMLASYDCP